MQALRNEIDEIKAMRAHVEDQTTTVIYDHNELSAKLEKASAKQREAVALGKDALVLHINVEVRPFRTIG